MKDFDYDDSSMTHVVIWKHRDNLYRWATSTNKSIVPSLIGGSDHVRDFSFFFSFTFYVRRFFFFLSFINSYLDEILKQKRDSLILMRFPLMSIQDFVPWMEIDRV